MLKVGITADVIERCLRTGATLDKGLKISNGLPNDASLINAYFDNLSHVVILVFSSSNNANVEMPITFSTVDAQGVQT